MPDGILGLFVGLTAAELATMKTEWMACLSAIASAHQSYSIAGRQITRANLAEVKSTIAEITYAQSLLSGTRQKWTYGDMRR